MENPVNKAGMARFGINIENALGISVTQLRPIAKTIKKDHPLALELWNTGIHEARLLACFIAEPSLMTTELLDKWVNDFNSWDICDQATSNLLDKCDLAIERIPIWASCEQEFVRRTPFALIAALAVHKKGEKYDDFFVEHFPLIMQCVTDERNFVKKAVNWAIRQIGKRSDKMRATALRLCDDIAKEYPTSKSANWIIKDAVRELTAYDFSKKRKYNFVDAKNYDVQ
jgi:3-methyladenine DNA glycosylase AlkD